MNLYQAFQDTLANLDFSKHIFCGLTANVDVILHFEGDTFARLQRHFNAIAPCSDTPPSAFVKTPADALRYAGWFIARNHGGEADIAGLAPVQPLIDLVPHYRAVGGTGIQAANWLAKAGFVNTELYIPQNDPAFASLVQPGIKSHDNNAYYKKLFGADASFSEVHCIVDYAPGTQVLTEEGTVASTTSDRIILSGDKANDKVRIADSFRSAASKPSLPSSLLVTGFNGPRLMEDFNLFVEDCQLLMREYRAANPGGFIHIEDCYQWDNPNERRKTVSETLWPLADSLAMNEVEFKLATTYFGLDSGDITAALLAMAVRHGLRRVCLHTASHSRVISTFSMEKERRALALATLFSSARAYYGEFVSLAKIREMIETTRNISENAPEPLHMELDKGYQFLQLPTLYGIRVKSSIGLGDAFSAGQVACL